MKKLILVLLFLPMFCSSQTILKKVDRMCVVDKSTNTNKCIDIFNMSIFIENDYLVIKSDVETTKYPIDAYYVKDGEKLKTFDVIVDGVVQTAVSVEDDFCKAFFISKSRNDFTAEFYFYK